MTKPFVIACVGPVPPEVTKSFSFKLLRQGINPKVVRVSPSTLCFVEIGQEVDLCDEGGMCGRWVVDESDLGLITLGWINTDALEVRALLEQMDFDPEFDDEYDEIKCIQRFFEAEHHFRTDEVAVAIYAGSLPRYAKIGGDDMLVKTFGCIFPDAEVVYLG